MHEIKASQDTWSPFSAISARALTTAIRTSLSPSSARWGRPELFCGSCPSSGSHPPNSSVGHGRYVKGFIGAAGAARIRARAEATLAEATTAGNNWQQLSRFWIPPAPSVCLAWRAHENDLWGQRARQEQEQWQNQHKQKQQQLVTTGSNWQQLSTTSSNNNSIRSNISSNSNSSSSKSSNSPT